MKRLALALAVPMFVGCGLPAAGAPPGEEATGGDQTVVPAGPQPGEGQLPKPKHELFFSRFGPGQGLPGVTVKFLGYGFSEVPAENVVSFGGAVAKVITVNKGYLEVELPANAKSGDVVLSVLGTSLIAGQFTVLDRPLLYSVSHDYYKPTARLHLTGDGFSTDSYVVFDGAVVTTELSFVNGLKALVGGVPLATGNYSVVACTPPHGCSAPLTLQVP